MRARTVWILLLAGVSSRAGAQRRPVVTPEIRRVAGCYTLTLGAWSDGMRYAVPTYFELDTLRFATNALFSGPGLPPGETTSLRLLPLSGDLEDSWDVDSAGVHVGWSSGFGGTSLLLRVRGDSLVGVAHSWTDVADGPPDPTAAAVARRVPCRALPK